MTQPVSVTVGVRDADLCGSDNRVLQAAVDYVGGLGGGEVRVGPGAYLMHDSLHLRSGVHLRGSGPDTLLVKAASRTSRLHLDGDYGEEQVTLVDAAGFEPGMGVTVTDDRSGGFHTTVARIRARRGHTLLLDWPLQADYLAARGAVAHTVFPVISGYYLKGVRLSDLSIDGNRQENAPLTGCRGAGIFLYRCHGARMERCVVRSFNGDGISFQQSNDVTISHCESAMNAALGLHPGSGSQRPLITDCHSHHNDRIGLYLCWRVRYGRFRRNRLEDNGEYGISIGHKDTDNLFEDCTASGNARYGIYLRPESEPMAGHRNTFVRCSVLDNGSGDVSAGVRVEGETRDTTLLACTVADTGSGRQRIGVSIAAGAGPVHLDGVEFSGHVGADVVDENRPV